MPHFNQPLWGNTLIVWIVACASALAMTAALYLARLLLPRLLRRRQGWRDAPRGRYLAALIAGTHPLCMAAVSLSLAAELPALPAGPARALHLLGPLALLAQAGLWGSITVSYWLETPLREAQARNPAAATRATVVGFLLRLLLGSLLLLAALGLLGFNITTLLASLGIGGIAVALAVQNILGDLFASLSIAIDDPFVVGDFIMIDEYLGFVEHVGLKTTRVRSISGELIIFSNTDMLKSRIRNFKRMAARRVVFLFGVDYGTPAEVLERIPDWVRAIVEGLAPTRFDRAHLKEFKESALVYEVVYFVLDPDHNLYMDIQQGINLGIIRAFQAEGVAFAAPRQVVRLRRG